MLKIIQKYRQYLLVVFGVILMVAFIVPQAGHFFGGDPMSRKVATVNGASVTANDMNKARTEHDVIRTLLDPLGMPKPIDLSKELFGAENDRHWMLLAKAAKEGGFMGSNADGQIFEKEIRDSVLIPLIARSAVAQQYPMLRQQPQYLDMFANNLMADPEQRKKMEEQADKTMGVLIGRALQASHGNPQVLQSAFSTANAIGRMQTAWREAHRVSDKRATFEADRVGDTVYVDQVLLLAKSIAPFAPKPSEEAMKALFDKYRDVRRGYGEHGFGYQLPARVKLEWMTIDRAAIGATVQLDPVEVNKYWRQNRAKYPGEFPAERARVEADLRDQRVDAIMSTIDKAVKAETIRLMGKTDIKDGYRALPADWATRMPRLESIAQLAVADVKQISGVSIPLPQVNVRADQFLNRTDIMAIPGLGEARIRLGSKEYGLPELVFRVKELVGSDPDVNIQVGVPFEMFAEDAARNRYYFMVLDARKAEAPATLDEVRGQVALDAQALEQFAKLEKQVPMLQSLAESDGLEGVSKFFLEAFPGASAPATRKKLAITANNIQAGDSTFNQAAYREAVIKLAKQLDPTKPVYEYPTDQRTLAIALDGPLSVVVAQLVGRSPISVERMRNEGDYFSMAYANRELPTKALREAYSFQALKDRMKFVDHDRTTEDSTETATTPEPPSETHSEESPDGSNPTGN